MAAVVAKVVSVAVGLITIPLTSRYLGSELFGMWLTSSSIVAMFGFADLGLSNGLLNLVADAGGRGDRLAMRKAVASAFWMLTAIACVLLLSLAIGFPYIQWPSIFNVHSAQAMRESGPMVAVMISCFAATLPLSTITSIQSGMQNGLVSNLWATAGSLVSLTGVYFATRHHASVVMLMFFLSIGPLASLILNGTHVFAHATPWLLPLPSFFSKRVAVHLLQAGVMFFAMQIAVALGYQSDNLVVAHVMGASSVPGYAVPSRLFNIPPLLVGIFTVPIWPAYVHAIASKDFAWIQRTFKATILWTGCITTAFTVLLVLSSKAILLRWVGPAVQPSYWLLGSFGVRCVLSAYLQPLSIFLNGVGGSRSRQSSRSQWPLSI
jgi:O-antigen/teichoic acid export membrane protein